MNIAIKRKLARIALGVLGYLIACVFLMLIFKLMIDQFFKELDNPIFTQ